MSSTAKKLADAASASGAPVDPEDLGTSFEDIEAKPVRWTWRPQIPRGKITILESNPGESKSALTVDLAARISSGSPMPDGTPCKQGTVIMLNAEDGAGDTVKPRLIAAGADCTRVIDFTTITEDGKERQVRLPEDVAALRALVKKHNAVMVVIDPLWSFVGSKHSSISDQKMREALTPLKELAEELDVAIIIIRHLNKNTKETNLTLRGAGSVGITGLARNVLTTIPDKQTKDRFYLARVKANLAPSSNPLCYDIESVNVKTDTGIANVPKLEWRGTVNASLFELASQDVELTHREKQVHALLPEMGGTSAQTVANKLGVSRTNVSNLLKGLSKKGAATTVEVGRYIKTTGIGFEITPFCDDCDTHDIVTNVTKSEKSGMSHMSDKSGMSYISDENTTTTTPDPTAIITTSGGPLVGVDVDAIKAQKIAEALHEEEAKAPFDFDTPEDEWMKINSEDE